MRTTAAYDVAARRLGTLRRREQVERLLDLAQHLPRQERLLLEALYRDGRSIQEVATLMGVPRRRLSRQVARLMRRIRTPEFRFILERGPALPGEAEAVARLVYLEGRSLRETARRTRRPLHEVRRHVHLVAAMTRMLG